MKLKSAKLLLDTEKSGRIIALGYNNDMARQIGLVMELLGKGQLNETIEKLQELLHSFTHCEHRRSVRDGTIIPLSTITEKQDSLESILSISDIELAEDDLEESRTRSGRSFKRKSSPEEQGDAIRKRLSSRKSKEENRSRKSGEEKESKIREVKTRITTSYTPGDDIKKFCAEVRVEPAALFHPATPTRETCTYDKNLLAAGRTPSRPPHFPTTPHWSPSQDPAYSCLVNNALTPRHGHSQVYGTPSNTLSPIVRNFSASKMNARKQSFHSKTIYKAENCQPCGKRIKFGKTSLKYRDCHATCHPKCRESVSIPCVPAATTPNTKGYRGTIADYTPIIPPMVPALVVHCCNEVENRGLNEVGIYRVPGAEKDVKELKERFLRGRGLPNLSQVDVNVICGTLKDFLRSLKEPLITHLWNDFASAADKSEAQDSSAALYQAISELPQPNRDTLAWIITPLQ
ncbi:Rac GTPase-activating protein 1, partial [Halocaridina rubra]